MSEKINFLSGEVLTATNLNKAFNEKLNANSIDDNSSISMENGIKLKSTVGIDLNINDSTKILLNNNRCKIIGNPIELRADKIDLYKQSGDKHSEIDLTKPTKVDFSKQVAAPSIYLNSSYINYSNSRRVYMPNLAKNEDDTLVGESKITEIKNEDLKKYWYTLSVRSGTTTLNSTIIDGQGEGITTLAKLVEKLDGILNDSYYSDRVYVNVSVNDTNQILKFCGKSTTGTSISYYFNNTEYKVKLSQNNSETTGSVIRSGFNKASVQNVYAGKTILKLSATDASSITCHLNDDGQVVKVLSFYMMRTETAQTIRITKLELPISIDGFPLYEGSTPVIKSARGVCGVWDSNNTRIKILSLDEDDYKMSVNASSIEFTFDWDDYPKYSNYRGYPTMIYAEWI